MPSNLKPYDAVSTGNEPYIAAEFSKMFVDKNLSFTVGDGKLYRKGSKRSRRNSASGFMNAKLEPGSYYSVFQRTFKSDVR